MSDVKLNDNCLAGLRCPACGSQGPFKIDAVATFEVRDEGLEVHGDVEGDDDNHIRCGNCTQTGSVRTFRIVVPQVQIVVLGGVVQKVISNIPVDYLLVDHDNMAEGDNLVVCKSTVDEDLDLEEQQVGLRAEYIAEEKLAQQADTESSQ